MHPHDLIRRLETNALMFDALTRGVSEEQARWRPEPGSWTLLEVVNHLADEEVEDFRQRVDLTLHRPDEPWPPIDPAAWVVERRYNERALAESVERLLARRDRSLRWLGRLERPDWSRSYTHPPHQGMRASDLLASWVAHDYIHIRQLVRLHRDYMVRCLAPDLETGYAGRW